MSELREFEGIGHFEFYYETDYLLVDEWTKRPDDVKGYSLTILKLLPRDLINLGQQQSGTRIFQSPKFSFLITVEINRVTDK